MKQNYIAVASLLILIIGCNSAHKLMKQTYVNNDFDQLEKLTKERLAENPNDAYANFMLGNVYLAHGIPDSAMFFQKKAVELKPKNSNYKEGLIKTTIVMGDTLLQQGSSRKAKELYLSVLKRDSSHFLAWTRLGLANRKTGFYDEAEKNYRKAYQINPQDSLQKLFDFFDSAASRSNLLTSKGIEQLQKKHYKKSMETLQIALDTKPDNQEAQYYLYLSNGLDMLKQGSVGDLWNAIDYFGKASTMRLQEAEPHYYMAQAYYKKDDKDFDNSIREYEQVIQLSPDSKLAEKAQKQIEELKKRQKLLKDFWGKQ